MRLLVAIALVSAAGCITPSIPIPPPDPTDIDATLTTTGSDSQVSFTYPPTAAYIGGIAEIYNSSVGLGVIETCHPDGSVGPTPDVAAHLGDAIVFSIVYGSETASTCVLLQAGPQDPNAVCP